MTKFSLEQVAEAKEWHASMQLALAHWSDHSMYGVFAQWQIFVQVNCTIQEL